MRSHDCMAWDHEDCGIAWCTCDCHDDAEEQTYGGYATPDEYYAEWGE